MARCTLRIFAVAALLSLLAIHGWGQSDAGKEAFKTGDYTTAYRIWKPLADRGDASAQYNLGRIAGAGFVTTVLRLSRETRLSPLVQNIPRRGQRA